MKRFWKRIKKLLGIEPAEKAPHVPVRYITVIVAGSHRQFVQWCTRRKIHAASRYVVYIPVDQVWYVLAGRDNVIKEIVYTGTWRERPDLGRLRMELRHIISKNRAIWDYDIPTREDKD